MVVFLLFALLGWVGPLDVGTLRTSSGAPTVALVAADVSAQSDTLDAPGSTPRIASVYRLNLDTRVSLDGRLDESFWQEIEPITDFVQQEPREGAAPTERTEVRIAYDANNLYVGAILFDSNPRGILGYQRRRNAPLSTDDRFMWIIDTFEDGRTAYFFEINPAGLMGDGLLRAGQGQGLNKSWDGIWDVRVYRGDFGWSAEIRIPFRTLNFDPSRTSWGINFQRTIRRKNEEMLWSGHLRNQGLWRPQHAGRLVGLEDLSQGLGLEVKPYAIAVSRRNWSTGSASIDPAADVGLDLTYSVTPNLRASLTINTDFAETEVDQRRVNLTRFPLVFPERRDFFLEGSSVFTFAPASNVMPYFSRRIGLVDGQPIPILFGGRIAGQVGDFDVGLVQVRTGRSGGVPVEDFTAARILMNVLSESTIGLVYTRRATRDDGPLQDRHTIGADLELATSTFRGNKNVQFQAFLVTHNAPVVDDTTSLWDRSTRGLRVSFPNPPWSIAASYREFGAAFNPAVGFVQRRAFRRFQPTFWYRPVLEESSLVRSLTFGLYFEYLTDLDFRPETVLTRVTLFGLEFESADEFEVAASRQFDRLFFPFDIRRDGSIIIPPGDYYTWNLSIEGATARHRRIAAGASWTHESFWTGSQSAYTASTTVRPLMAVGVTGFWSHNRVRLREGRFDTHLVRLSGSFDVSPRISLTSNVQYDNLSELVGFYARFRWIIRPGSDLFLVYTHNWLTDDWTLRPLEQQATTKLTYTHRF